LYIISKPKRANNRGVESYQAAMRLAHHYSVSPMRIHQPASRSAPSAPILPLALSLKRKCLPWHILEIPDNTNRVKKPRREE